MRILIAEDDAPLASFLRKGLGAEHYSVDLAGDGDTARDLAVTYDYDLLVLDLNLPKQDGIAVLQEVRNSKDTMPILILSGRTKIEDRVAALDKGADDYVTKPFSFSELSARVRAMMRRGKLPQQTLLQVADLVLDRVEHKVERAGQRIDLTSKEFSLLEYLMRNNGRCITRAMIIEHVWNISFDTTTNVVDVYINYLRKKIDENATRKLIHTVRGVGYLLSHTEVPNA
jgi:DNA-binding response OmpR family regulator